MHVGSLGCQLSCQPVCLLRHGCKVRGCLHRHGRTLRGAFGLHAHQPPPQLRRGRTLRGAFGLHAHQLPPQLHYAPLAGGDKPSLAAEFSHQRLHLAMQPEPEVLLRSQLGAHVPAPLLALLQPQLQLLHPARLLRELRLQAMNNALSISLLEPDRIGPSGVRLTEGIHSGTSGGKGVAALARTQKRAPAPWRSASRQIPASNHLIHEPHGPLHTRTTQLCVGGNVPG